MTTTKPHRHSHPLNGILAGLAFAVSAFAQGTTGSFIGTVTGPTGASIPAANVVVHNTGNGQTRSTTSNNNGDYEAPLLPPGAYEISIEASGFAKSRKTGIALLVNQVSRVDFQLQITSVSETVTVEANVSLVDTSDSSVRQVVMEKQIVDLPLNGRNFRSLGLTVPGVADMSQGSNLASRGGGMNIVGAKDIQNNFLLDGFDNNDPTTGETLTFPTVDSIQEFGITGANYGADTGFASGGIVTLVTKSGTQTLHGDLFEFIRNDKLNARNFFAPNIPALKRNQFGGTVGGSVPHTAGKLFYFGGYESTVEHAGITAAATVATTGMRGGNFTGIRAITDPFNGNAPFAGATIPPQRLNKIGFDMLNQLFPLPTTGTTTNNFVSSPSVPNNLQVGTGRMDYSWSEKNTFFGRYSSYWQTTDDTTTGPFQIIYNQLIKHNWNIGGEWTHVFGPRTVSEARFSFGKVDNEKWAKNQQNWDKILGIPGPTLGLDQPNQISGGPPIINLTGYSAMSTNGNQFIRLHYLYQYAYQVSHQIGNHSLRIGEEIRHYRMDITNSANPQGTFTFTGTYSGNAVSDLLLGVPATTQNLIGPQLNDEINWEQAAYVQDNWRATRKLSLNLGFRYEYQSPDTSSKDIMGGFVPSLGKAVQVGTNGLPRGFRNDYYKNFAPRLGFAYDVGGNGKTSIRGGYGIYYQALTHNVFQPSGFTSFPISKAGVFTNSALPAAGFTATAQPAVSLNNPFPAALASSTFSATGYDVNYHGGRTQRWQVGVQRSIGKKGVFEATYVGSTTENEVHAYALNQPKATVVTGTTPSVQARRPFNTYSTITFNDGTGAARYKGLLTKYEQRLAGGLQLLGSYTFSKTTSNNEVSNQDPDNRAADWGRTSFDTRHRFVASAIYALPFKNLLARDWQFATITTLAAGNPFTPTMGFDNAGTGTTNNQRPNLTGDPNAGVHTPTLWFDPSLYSRPAAGTFGNAEPFSITGPGVKTVDVSLKRTFKFSERLNMEIRAEGFNMMNHANFNLPSAVFATTAFNAAGQYSGSPGTTGRISQAKSPREYQFGAKFHF